MKTLVVLCAIFLLIGCSCNKKMSDKSMITIDFDDPNLVTEIHCALLIQAFKDDKVYAKQQYDGKEYMISGIVDRKGKGTLTDKNKEYLFEGRSYITLCDSTLPVVDFIICLYNEEKSENFAKLSIGDSVMVKGLIDANSDRIIVDNCEVIDDTFIKWGLITP